MLNCALHFSYSQQAPGIPRNKNGYGNIDDINYHINQDGCNQYDEYEYEYEDKGEDK